MTSRHVLIGALCWRECWPKRTLQSPRGAAAEGVLAVDRRVRSPDRAGIRISITRIRIATPILRRKRMQRSCPFLIRNGPQCRNLPPRGNSPAG